MNKIAGIRQLGVTLTAHNAQITVWAPQAKSVLLHAYAPNIQLPLTAQAYGYWYAESNRLQAGQQYRIAIDENEYPDPVSRSQPEGVHGPSAIVDLQFDWTDEDYHPPSLRDLIIYELHVGTFTPNRDFEGVIERLPYLKTLGINAIEIMPVAQFPGERNWGYDGVFSFAVQHSYGGAKDLQKLVDACHREDIAVILDVVYNHFGPEGNYLPAYGPYFTDKYQTPWGQAINYDDAWNNGVRDFVLANVYMWLSDFHIDGLRLDAVHAIKDFSPRHILQEMREVTNKVIQQSGKSHFLIAECDLNDRRYLEPLEKNGLGMDAQWLDEFHHSLRVAAGEKRNGYYSEFEGVKHLTKAYQEAYVFDGGFSPHRQKFFGTSAADLPDHQFIVFSQNHDQIGNRMLGERSGMLYSPEIQRLMATAVMISPYTPMLFMGEEWASKKPFLYFVDHSDPDLIQAVREGRRREFADFHDEGEIPDPQAQDTFDQSILDWNEKEGGPHRDMLAYYRALISLRKNHPLLQQRDRKQFQVVCYPHQHTIFITVLHETSRLLCILNFSSSDQTFSLDDDTTWQKIWDSNDAKWGGCSSTNNNFLQVISVEKKSGTIFERAS